MRLNLENLIAMLVLIGTEAWFLKGLYADSPDFEPALAFIAAIAAIFLKDPIKQRLGYGKATSSHDRMLFERFQTEFPVDPTIRFLEQHDFGDAFLAANVEPLTRFVETWNSVETEFLDQGIQSKKETLYGAAKRLASEINLRTVPVRMAGYASVYPDSLRDLGQPRPKHILDDADILNTTASSFVPVYTEFIRYCKAKLSDG